MTIALLASAEPYRHFTNKLDSNATGHSEPSFASDGIIFMPLDRNGLARD
jgi:hypothetical protein